MTYIVSGVALNSTHSLCQFLVNQRIDDDLTSVLFNF